MVFNSLTFVAFFACVLALHNLPLPSRTKKVNLLIASYLFYAAWNPPFVILLWVSTVVDWWAVRKLVDARRPAARHAWMLLSVVANLGMLGYFKYGGFLLGACMPRGMLTEEIKKKIEPMTVVFLLPMFFTYSGLNTQLTAVNSLSILAVAVGILLVSIAAKFGACWLAARLAGEDNRTALGIGALMNSRGLMELIIINIGLQKGVIGPTLFSMMVLMAIVTTMMAGPLFELVYGKKARESGELDAISGEDGAAPTQPLVERLA